MRSFLLRFFRIRSSVSCRFPCIRKKDPAANTESFLLVLTETVDHAPLRFRKFERQSAFLT